nr:HupE/UreJ family protein [Synechococcus sp. CBW1006]
MARTTWPWAWLAGVALALVPMSVWAHADAHPGGGFVAGLLHPISGLDHVVAMVAVGLWGAVLGPPALWVLPVAFPMVMALGGCSVYWAFRFRGWRSASPSRVW